MMSFSNTTQEKCVKKESFFVFFLYFTLLDDLSRYQEKILPFKNPGMWRSSG